MIAENHPSLKPFNTFQIDAKAKSLVRIRSTEDLQHLFQTGFFEETKPWMVLGGGSNILLTQDFPGVMLKMEIEGISVLNENENKLSVRVGAGEIWHRWVMYAVEHQWCGLENLSLIPGTVGAAPIQNIGAYGVELQDVFYGLDAFNVELGTVEFFNREDCAFGYRDSFFKKEGKGKYIITSVVFELSKTPQLQLGYGAIQQKLDELYVQNPGIADVSRAVIEIRSSKLPDPKQLGNAGSFFKNPEVSLEQYQSLKEKFPNMVAFPGNSGGMKLAAGWLIEQCGWKGKRVGNTGAHKDQALVLVNYGSANGTEIWNLALAIQKSVQETFGVHIHPEVNIV